MIEFLIGLVIFLIVVLALILWPRKVDDPEPEVILTKIPRPPRHIPPKGWDESWDDEKPLVAQAVPVPGWNSDDPPDQEFGATQDEPPTGPWDRPMLRRPTRLPGAGRD